MSNHQVFECEKDFGSEYSKGEDGVISCNCNEVTGCGGGEETMCLGYGAKVEGTSCTCKDFTSDSTPKVKFSRETKFLNRGIQSLVEGRKFTLVISEI